MDNHPARSANLSFVAEIAIWLPTISASLSTFDHPHLAHSSPPLPTTENPSSNSSLTQQSPETASPDAAPLKPSHVDPHPAEPSSQAQCTNLAQENGASLKRTKDERERRKRNSVTPEQLVELENAFNRDRSPTSTERRGLGTRIGMAERAVQIWFQNRRAKAKHQLPRVPAPTHNPPPLTRPSSRTVSPTVMTC